MGRRRVDSIRSQIDASFARAERIPFNEIELRADLARYLCVTVLGYIERAVTEVTSQYCEAHASLQVGRFAAAQLSRPGNLNSERLLQLLGSFDPNWRELLQEYFDEDEQRKLAIDSLVANRNNIAHGDPVGLTIAGVQIYYTHAQEVVDRVKAILA